MKPAVQGLWAILALAFQLVGVCWVHSQDTLLSHWPQVEQGRFDPALQKRVHSLVNELLAMPLRLNASRWTSLPERGGAGWEALHEERRHTAKRNFSEATNAANTALDIARRTDDRALEMNALSDIGHISREVFLGSSLKAVPYHEQALQMARELQDTAYAVQQLIALADNYGQAGQPQRFLEYTQSAALLLRQCDHRELRFRLILQFGLFSETADDLKNAEQILTRLADLGRAAKNKQFVESLHWQLFDLYLKEGEMDQAQQALDSLRATVPAEELNEASYKLEKMRGNHEKAFHYLEKAYRSLGDDYVRRSGEQLAAWEVRLHTQEKELQLEAQKRQRRVYFALVAVLVLLFAGAVYTIYQQRKSRKALTAQKSLIEQQADELRQLDRQKSVFFANISHELRTPLTLILGPLEQSLRAADLPAQGRRLLEIARFNGRHLLDLVNQLLEMGRAEFAPATLNESPAQVSTFLSELVATFRPTAESKRVGLVFHDHLPPDLWASLDRARWRGVFSNLLANALKFTPSGGQVSLTAHQSADELQFEVRDSGAGIHADDLPHVFERYYQSRKPAHKAEGGFGIGLSLVQETVALMGGDIGVESEVGRGSVFSLRLPLKASVPQLLEEAAAAEPAAANVPLPAVLPPASARILVVEDNTGMQEYLRTVLSENRCQVHLAENGRMALDGLSSTERLPDLIITDLMMPEMDGFEFLKRLKAEERYQAVPVIVLTAWATGRTELEALRIGVDDFLVKPFDTDELLAHMGQLLANVESRREASLDDDDRASETPTGMPASIQTWLSALEQAALARVGDPHFNLEALSTAMGLSSRQMLRRLKAATGLTAAQYVQELRLQEARHLLAMGQTPSVKALSEAVGLRDPKYFSQLYKKRFGKLPSAPMY